MALLRTETAGCRRRLPPGSADPADWWWRSRPRFRAAQLAALGIERHDHEGSLRADLTTLSPLLLHFSGAIGAVAVCSLFLHLHLGDIDVGPCVEGQGGSTAAPLPRRCWRPCRAGRPNPFIFCSTIWVTLSSTVFWRRRRDSWPGPLPGAGAMSGNCATGRPRMGQGPGHHHHDGDDPGERSDGR